MRARRRQPRWWNVAACGLLAAGATARAGEPEPHRAALSDGERLLAQAKVMHPKRYQFAMERGATVLPTPDGRSFAVLWMPPDPEPSGANDIGDEQRAGREGRAAGLPDAERRQSRRAMVVTLHGQAGWAFDELFLWQPPAAEYRVGVLAVQWWFGSGERVEDYYTPQQLYPIVEAMLRAQHIPYGRALLHGFSRGATTTYALTALDRVSGNWWFGLTLANAGGASPDDPPNADIADGRLGTTMFRGTHWVLFCGGQDPEPQRDGCPAMERTQGWIERFGGRVDRMMEDPQGDHGAFHHNPENRRAVLQLFRDTLRSPRVRAKPARG